MLSYQTSKHTVSAILPAQSYPQHVLAGEQRLHLSQHRHVLLQQVVQLRLVPTELFQLMPHASAIGLCPRTR